MNSGDTGFDTNGGSYLGIDVGGTDVKLGLIDHRGKLWAKHRVPTQQLSTPIEVAQYAVRFAEKEIHYRGTNKSYLGGIGLAVPGILDSATHTLLEVVNLPQWTQISLPDVFDEVFDGPIAIVNDANAAAFAEHRLRRLENQDLALVTLGTGIGCGLVVSGSPFNGNHGCAGELGHVVVDYGPDAKRCSCGRRGHLEAYAGAAGVIAQARKAIMETDASVPSGLRGEDLSPLRIAAEAEKGDQIARRVVASTGRHVGHAVAILGQTLDPSIVLLGGAMTFGKNETQTGANFLDVVRETVTQATLAQVSQHLSVEFATLGNDAGVLGAAMLANETATGSRCDLTRIVDEVRST